MKFRIVNEKSIDFILLPRLALIAAMFITNFHLKNECGRAQNVALSMTETLMPLRIYIGLGQTTVDVILHHFV